MKFAHSFEEALKLDEYPQSWVKAAISYRSLKKCIKDVQHELESIGLDIDTLQKQLHAFQYTFDDVDHKPRLLFQVEKPDGTPVSASLSPYTRELLQKLAVKHRSLSDSGQPMEKEGNQTSTAPHATPASSKSTELVLKGHNIDVQTVEIPLTSDSRFFYLLNEELTNLSTLTAQEEVELTDSISQLGDTIQDVTEPNRNSKATDLYAWRDLFSLYVDSQIFFTMGENSKRVRNSTAAQSELQLFSERLSQIVKRFKRSESKNALRQFMRLNYTLLQTVKFQELNVTAMTKILKKFDKRTALGARETFPGLVASESVLPSTLAKSVCYQMSEKLVKMVPQLSDYLCPVCFSISYKPIRLSDFGFREMQPLTTVSIFCIRCLVVMQRSRQNHCPMCRGEVLLEADSGNLDVNMMTFLKKYFPDEVKMKQKENEHAAAVDRYGNSYNQKCCMM